MNDILLNKAATYASRCEHCESEVREKLLHWGGSEEETDVVVRDTAIQEYIESGLLEEVENLYKRNLRCKSINTGIGYKELYQYFDNEIYERII